MLVCHFICFASHFSIGNVLNMGCKHPGIPKRIVNTTYPVTIKHIFSWHYKRCAILHRFFHCLIYIFHIYMQVYRITIG